MQIRLAPIDLLGADYSRTLEVPKIPTGKAKKTLVLNHLKNQDFQGNPVTAVKKDDLNLLKNIQKNI